MAISRFERELRSATWPRSAGDLLSRGVTRYALSSATWVQTSRGYYVPAAAAASPAPTQRILNATPIIPPSGALGGWASAFVQGVDVLDGLDGRTLRPLPVPVVRGATTGHARRDGVVASNDRLDPAEVVVRFEIACTAGPRTAFDGSRRAESLEEAVAFVDACAHAGLIQTAEVSRYCNQHKGWRGVEQARRACQLADAAARGPWESRFRVFYMLEAGLPRPLVNQPVFDLTGTLVGIPDLLDPEAGVASEFDGQHHRGRRQHRADNVREEGLEALGLLVTRADSLDLRDHRPELARRLRSTHRRGLLRDRSRDRWTLREPDWWLEQTGGLGEELTDQEKEELFGGW